MNLGIFFRIMLFISTVTLSLPSNAFLPAKNWRGVSACNMGIFVESAGAPDQSLAVIRSKAEELFLPDEENPQRYVNAFHVTHRHHQPLIVYAFPYTAILHVGRYRYTHDYLACSVSECPDGYTQVDGKCLLQCGENELRAEDGSCYCPEGIMCPGQNMGPPPGCPSPDAGNPINTAIGNKHQTERDFEIIGSSLFYLERTYNSQANKKGLFGKNWTSNLEQRIITVPGSSPEKLKAVRDSGAYYYFVRSRNDNSSRWVPLAPIKDQLRGRSIWSYRSGEIIETFDENGFLATKSLIASPSSKLTTRYMPVSSNMVSRLDEVVDEYGRKVAFTYDSQNRVTLATLPNNDTISYTYNTSSQLTSVVHSNGLTRVYKYNEADKTGGNNLPNALTGIETGDGTRISSWYYNSQGYAIASEQGDGSNRTEITYNADGTSTVTNPLGKKTSFTFDVFNGQRKITQVEGHASDNCAAANKAYTYYNNGTLKTKTDWQGRVTEYTRDDYGREIERTEAKGTPDARTIKTEWHPTLNVKTKVIEPKTTTEWEYFDDGKLKSTNTKSIIGDS